ncbi:helix-turn-helix transcriptional regulator [Chitinophaga solisilvae]|uniref:Helix-turn-helix transcriptional regulator n=1 Tax=Chitinophaga solisilvae TaxID=1233460 RepID=A0A3S1JKG0_9BACT|nr:AraC family transcriptional regulator [Chitinophaga solisilvae]NSL86941.1 helix-turn-helix transcriptional regulator [Chitinophaga solisilvae]
MLTIEFQGSIHFQVPVEMEMAVKTSSDLPPVHSPHRISEAALRYTEGPFGSFISQEIRTTDWVINWIHSFINHPVTLETTVSQPMVTLCSVLQGSHSWQLHGEHQHVNLQQHTSQFYYVPADMPHEILLKKGTHQLMFVSFSPDYVGVFSDLHPWFRDINYKLLQQSGKAAVLPACFLGKTELDVLDSMQKSPQQGVKKKFFLHARIVDMVVLYISALSKNQAYTSGEWSTENRIINIAEYIRQHFSSPLTVPQLSRDAGMSVSTFERAFKRVFGESPLNYIVECRLQEGAQLLAGTTIPVKEISNNVGFSNPNYFTTSFKKRFGITPLDYRRNGHIAEKI